jgi:DNA-binding MarR family transcriptional regulator
VDGKFQEPGRSPGFLLWRASLEWRRAIERRLAPIELTQPQFVVLAGTGWLTRHGISVRQVDLARHIGMDVNTLSQILRGLERRKLLTRDGVRRHAARRPRLTAHGEVLLARALESVEAADAAFFALPGRDVVMLLPTFSALIYTDGVTRFLTA